MPIEPEDLEETEETEGSDRPSKSQLKRDMLELQALGAELVELPDDHLRGLSLPENLLAAILEYKRTPTHGGRRRQMQYIGKLMRGLDAEPARSAVDAVRRGRESDTQALHEAERWRARFLEGDDALTEWVRLYPESDPRKLRSLIRCARSAPEPTARRALRELFRFIRAQLLASASAAGSRAG